jgi:hypothetical protein
MDILFGIVGGVIADLIKAVGPALCAKLTRKVEHVAVLRA